MKLGCLRFSFIWRMEIDPYLEEYFYNSLEQVEQFRWDEAKDKILV